LIDPSTISLFKLENVESIKWAELSDQKNMKIVASNTTNLHAINFGKQIKDQAKASNINSNINIVQEDNV